MDKELYKIHSEVCKVFSNPTRLEILDLLRGRGLSVSALMKKTGLSQANVSQHLSIMKSKGIVAYERKGKNVYYRLQNPKVVKAFDIMREALIENLRKRL
ncbi:MAG: metalloregulator ArsR/SmtB family transcription factor [Candidatus Anstonellaceae archaeon]